VIPIILDADEAQRRTLIVWRASRGIAKRRRDQFAQCRVIGESFALRSTVRPADQVPCEVLDIVQVDLVPDAIQRLLF
jgi:hypothetical protein